jgi:DNA-binding LacI/PurR family transcriptional regulator
MTEPRAHDITQPARLPTIRDVARVANVSVGTVSKALNGQGSLREETRLHVQTVAKQMGFRPNDLVLSMLRQRSFTVGLISTTVPDSFCSRRSQYGKDALN